MTTLEHTEIDPLEAEAADDVALAELPEVESADSAPEHSDEASAPEQPGQQAEMPFALVQGEPLTTIPEDLYIPPDALEVILEAFEGPLDLLLYLIKRQNLDILDIPIADITRQYVSYIDLIQDMRFELAAEYLVMAAMLAEIKSRMLLPRPVSEDDDELDPRAELVRRLQEYECFKQAAQNIDELPRQGRDVFQAHVEPPDLEVEKPLAEVELRELLIAFQEVMQRVDRNVAFQIHREPLSIRERMTHILGLLQSDSFIDFHTVFDPKEGKLGVVVSFMAILELLKQSVIEIIQAEPYSPIHLKAAA